MRKLSETICLLAILGSLIAVTSFEVLRFRMSTNQIPPPEITAVLFLVGLLFISGSLSYLVLWYAARKAQSLFSASVAFAATTICVAVDGFLFDESFRRMYGESVLAFLATDAFQVVFAIMALGVVLLINNFAMRPPSNRRIQTDAHESGARS